MQDKKIKMKIARELAHLSTPREMLKGSISKVVLGARKKGTGTRVSYLLTYKGAGNKTRTVYVKKNNVAETKKMIDNYRKAKRSLEQIVELNMMLFKAR